MSIIASHIDKGIIFILQVSASTRKSLRRSTLVADSVVSTAVCSGFNRDGQDTEKHRVLYFNKLMDHCIGTYI